MPHPCEHIGPGITPHGRKIRHALLHSRGLHVILLTLLVVDALICMFSGVLESQYFEGTAEDLTKYICSKNTNKDAHGTPEFGCRPPAPHHRRLTGSDGFENFLLAHQEEDGATRPRFLSSGHAGATPSPAVHGNASGNSSVGHAVVGHAGASAHGSRSQSTCVEDIGHDHNFGNHDLHTAEVTLAKISAAILVFFLLEQIVLIGELGREYLHPMFVLDLFVIVSSLTVEILLISNAWGVGASSGLLVIARIWRFARVGHGMLASSEEAHEIVEEDSSVESLENAWNRLSDDRWAEIKKRLTKEELAGTLTEDELKMVKELGQSPAVALRALAFARAWKKKNDKKKALKGALPGQMPTEILGQSTGI